MHTEVRPRSTVPLRLQFWSPCGAQPRGRRWHVVEADGRVRSRQWRAKGRVAVGEGEGEGEGQAWAAGAGAGGMGHGDLARPHVPGKRWRPGLYGRGTIGARRRTGRRDEGVVGVGGGICHRTAEVVVRLRVHEM